MCAATAVITISRSCQQCITISNLESASQGLITLTLKSWHQGTCVPRPSITFSSSSAADVAVLSGKCAIYCNMPRLALVQKVIGVALAPLAPWSDTSRATSPISLKSVNNMMDPTVSRLTPGYGHKKGVIEFI